MKLLYKINLALILIISLYACKKNPTVNPTPIPITNITVKDTDNNVYNVVKIGDRYWTTENARMKHFRNGDTIRNLLRSSDWQYAKTPTDSAAWCIAGDIPNKNFGNLYNWYTITDVRQLAPKGYHVATTEDWNNLISTLTKDQECQELKSKHLWVEYDADSLQDNRNKSLFTAVPAGFRTSVGAEFDFKFKAYFWAVATGSPNKPGYYILENTNNSINRNRTEYPKQETAGASVRFVRDN